MYVGMGVPPAKPRAPPKGDTAAVNAPRARKRKSFLPVRHVADDRDDDADSALGTCSLLAAAPRQVRLRTTDLLDGRLGGTHTGSGLSDTQDAHAAPSDRLAGAYKGAPIDLLPTGTAFQVRRRGEDERFTGSKLRVPKGTLRDRREDVLSQEVLVRRHAGYRNRVLMGPSFRADVWTALEHAPDLSIADIARKASCSFATAWQAAQDYRLLRSAGSRAPQA